MYNSLHVHTHTHTQIYYIVSQFCCQVARLD
jgi:hypothetical protein